MLEVIPTYRPGDFLDLSKTSTPPYALLIVNQPITDKALFLHLWKHAKLRVCTDGGANRVLRVFGTDEEEAGNFLPDCITGDLDSLQPSTRAFYLIKGVPLVPQSSQDSTDFSKGLQWIKQNTPAGLGELSVFALGAVGGRLDHTFHAIHQLFKFPAGYPDSEGQCARLYLIAPPNFTFLLRKGKNRLLLPKAVFGRGICGLIPVKGSAYIKTTGLRWDLDWISSVGNTGGGLSTSNELGDGEEVIVETDNEIVFTIEYGNVGEL